MKSADGGPSGFTAGGGPADPEFEAGAGFVAAVFGGVDVAGVVTGACTGGVETGCCASAEVDPVAGLTGALDFPGPRVAGAFGAGFLSAGVLEYVAMTGTDEFDVAGFPAWV